MLWAGCPPGGQQWTYRVATALVKGAHRGVELFNGQRHGGLQRGGKSSQSACWGGRRCSQEASPAARRRRRGMRVCAVGVESRRARRGSLPCRSCVYGRRWGTWGRREIVRALGAGMLGRLVMAGRCWALSKRESGELLVVVKSFGRLTSQKRHGLRGEVAFVNLELVPVPRDKHHYHYQLSASCLLPSLFRQDHTHTHTHALAHTHATKTPNLHLARYPLHPPAFHCR